MTLIENKQPLFVLIVALLLVVVVALAIGASLHMLHFSLVHVIASTTHPDVISHSH
jgi:hypothetical protein